MRIYNVGHDELGEYDLAQIPHDEYQWLVYSYTIDSYEGFGEAVALTKGGEIHVHLLSHCSCYGPLDEWGRPRAVVSPEEYLRAKDSVHDFGSLPEVEAKVRELLGAIGEEG